MKLIFGILAFICTALVCVVGWVVYVTRWKTTVDMDLKTLKDKNPVGKKDCETSHENCEKHISSEFGHGSARFKRLEEKIDAKDTKDEARHEGLLKSMNDILLEMAKR